MKSSIIATIGVLLIIATTQCGKHGNICPIMVNDKRSATNPVISTLGAKIAFNYCPNRYSSSAGLYIVDINGKNLNKIIDGMPSECTWSNDDKKLAFVMAGRLYVYDLNNNICSEISEGTSPVWSYNGEMIAFKTFIEKDQIIAINEVVKDFNNTANTTIKKISIPVIKIFDIGKKLFGEIAVPNIVQKSPAFSWIENNRLIFIEDSIKIEEGMNSWGRKNIINTYVGWNIIEADLIGGNLTYLIFIPKDIGIMSFYSIAPGGKNILFERGETIWLVDIDKNIIEKIIDTKVSNISWSRDGSLIFYATGKKIWMYNIMNGKKRKIAEIWDMLLSLVSSNSNLVAFSATSPKQNPAEDGDVRRGAIFVGKLKY